ncbi:MAG: ester cyclase [Acidimicrobiales bacterium]
MDNEQIVKEVYELAFSRGQLDILDQYIKEDYVNHNKPPNAAPGRAGLKATMVRLRGSCPDLAFVIEELVCEGDRVAVRARMQGTDTGGMNGAPPTGRKFSIDSLAMIRLEGGTVVERWGLHDTEKLESQLRGPAQHL